MNLIKYFQLLSLIFSAVVIIICYPIGPSNVMGIEGIPSAEAFEFMKKYGYIEKGDGNSDALFTKQGLEDVIRNVQKFGAIPQTGKLDNATMKLMITPRCGVADIIKTRQKRFILGPSGWNKRNITFFIANWPPTMNEEEVAKYITLALDTWGRYGRLSFQRISSPSADIVVAFGRGYHGDRYPFDGPGNVLAHAFFPYEMESYGGDIHFDSDENWTTKPNEESGIDFFTVAVHELGHSLGLAHSHIPSSVMFPYYTGNGPHLVLDYDDILGMYELYIRRRLTEDDTNSIEEPPTTEPNYPNVPDSSEEYWTTKRIHTVRTTRQYQRRTTSKKIETTTSLNPRTTSFRSDTTTKFRTSTMNYDRSSTVYPSDNKTVAYDGDYETVDEHKKHDPKHGIPPTNSPSLPDVCMGKYDAVASLRNEIFIFIDQYIWRLRDKFDLVPGYPISLQQMFPKLPEEIKKIDAAYERPDGNIVLFTGNHYWVYDGTNFVEDSPKSLEVYGLPRYLENIDAVQNWAKNGKTYFYKNDQFWRYNETSKSMDREYPKHMERWRGVPVNLDAATTWKGITYFFKDQSYWKFDNDWVIVNERSPLPTPQTWLGCPKLEDDY